MGLTDLIEEPDRKKDPSEGNVDRGIGSKPVVGDSYPNEDVEYGVDYKACPHCGCKSPAEDHRTWSCPYPGCGVIHFTMSWNEFRSETSFLGSVEMDGWEYNG